MYEKLDQSKFTGSQKRSLLLEISQYYCLDLVGDFAGEADKWGSRRKETKWFVLTQILPHKPLYSGRPFFPDGERKYQTECPRLLQHAFRQS